MSNWAKMAFNKGRVIGLIETIQRGMQEEKIMMDLHSEYMVDELRKAIDDLCDSVETRCNLDNIVPLATQAGTEGD